MEKVNGNLVPKRTKPEKRKLDRADDDDDDELEFNDASTLLGH